MEGELKPCPFCGNDKIELTYQGNAYSKKRAVTIKCKNCIISRTTGTIRFGIDWCEEKAITLWNTREAENGTL